MGRVIAVANQKGGVSKTTTATALATGLQYYCDKKTLLIDTDPQCDASDTYGANIEGETTLYDVLYDNEPIENAIQSTEIGDIIPCDPLLVNADSFLNKTGREYRLKKATAPILDKYEYIIVDTPPALSILLINALTLANSVIVPITADRYPLKGLKQLSETISVTVEFTNPALTVSGILLTKYNNRTNLSKEVFLSLPDIANMLNTKIYDVQIRESTAMKEAQSLRTSIFNHAPNSTTAKDYIELVKLLLKEEGEL